MSILETKHTMAAVEKIKNDLSNFMQALSIGSMIFFSLYYAFSIYLNVASLLKLIAYIILFITVITTFVIERILKGGKNDSHKVARLKVEKRRIAMTIVKSFKYSAKAVTVGIALYFSLTTTVSDLIFLLNIVSCGLLFIQLLSEFIIHFVNKYMDYITLGFEMDMDESFLAKFIVGKELKEKALAMQLCALEGEDFYTPQEQKIRDHLKNSANALKKQKEEDIKLKIRNHKIKIKKLTHKLSEKQRFKIENKYNASKEEAAELIKTSEKIDALCENAKKLQKKLPKSNPVAENVPNLVSLIGNYISGRYKAVSLQSVIAAIAALIYLVSPFDVIPDALPVLGYIDESFVIGLCLNIIGEELEKFLIWKENNR